MIIKYIERENFKLLVEEQRLGNIVYRISDSYAPLMDNIGMRVCIKKINEKDEKIYDEIHGLDLSYGDLRSYYLLEDKNNSSHGGDYLDNKFGYYEEIISYFEELKKSGKSEFTPKALKVLEEIKKIYEEMGSKTNAI